MEARLRLTVLQFQRKDTTCLRTHVDAASTRRSQDSGTLDVAKEALIVPSKDHGSSSTVLPLCGKADIIYLCI